MRQKQGRVRKRPKIWVSYLSKINFLVLTKTNNQLFWLGINRGSNLSIQTKNYEKITLGNTIISH